MEFKEGYDLLSLAHQNVVKNTILQMPKEHKSEEPEKKFRVGDVIKTYCKKAGIKLSSIQSIFYRATSLMLAESTIKSILYNHIKNWGNSDYTQRLLAVLNIPVNEYGIPYVEVDFPFHKKQFLITTDYYEYATEFQRNSVYQNFNCLSQENQRIIMRLVMELYQCEFGV